MTVWSGRERDRDLPRLVSGDGARAEHARQPRRDRDRARDRRERGAPRRVGDEARAAALDVGGDAAPPCSMTKTSAPAAGTPTSPSQT